MDKNEKSVFEKIATIFAPKAIWPYSQAVKVRKTMYSSGQIWLVAESWELEKGIEAQAERVCKNLWEVLKEAWLDYENVLKTTIYLVDIEDYKTVNEIYAKYFAHQPARSTVQVAWLPMWALVEIEVIAKEF